MTELPVIIKGGSHKDSRGTISFVNDFRMDEIKRFYVIRHPDKQIVRAWRGHKIEQRWFHVYRGSFIVKLILIDNWDNPGKNSAPVVFILKATDNCVLHIPKGYASGLKALEDDSEMIVYADSLIGEAKNDDYLFPLDHFGDWDK